MKRSSQLQSAFLEVRVFVSFILLFSALLLAITGFGISAQGQATKPQPAPPAGGRPDVVRMTAYSQDLDLRALPDIPAREEGEEVRLMRHPLPMVPSTQPSDPFQAVRKYVEHATAMPTPLATFAGLNSSQACGSCLPPDTHGDVGPNHYIQSVNSSIKIFDKTGAALNGTNGTTYNSFFSGLAAGGTPCGLNQNGGDGFVFYDQLADRWVVSDFAFSAFPGPGPFYQCIGVSKTSDPVAGGWWLYAIQVDPANVGFLGDYPKFALWPDAYYLTMNEFSGLSQATEAFEGVRVYALDRSSMINGGSANAVGFSITPANLGDAYSLVPATFRAGLQPPAGRPEYLLAIDSPASGGVTLTQVHAWRFHADFVSPANSTLGLGPGHTLNANVTVSGFTDAFTTTTLIVPQNGTSALLDTLGDKIMTSVVYQNLAGVESLWAAHTINNNQGGTGPTAIRWYQFDVTGSTIPATPTQQQTFDNGADGMWRWMPSIGVDSLGNMAIGYSVSSSTSEPSIRYAGRLATDTASTLAQGEAIMIAGGGHQTSSSGRWGDYSGMGIDPSDNLTFWHTNEYYTATSSASWATRIGKFAFAAPGTPTPTATATATATGTPSPTATASATATATASPTPTSTATATATATPTATPTASVADWPYYQHDASHTGDSPAVINPPALALAWTAPSSPTGYSTPVIVGNSIYAMQNQQGIGGSQTKVSSFDLSTGAINWSYTGNFVFPSQPGVGGGFVTFVGSSSSNSLLYVLDAITGAFRYTVPVPEGTGSLMPTIVQNPVGGNITAFVAGGSQVSAVSLGPVSGSVLWTQSGSFGVRPFLPSSAVRLCLPGRANITLSIKRLALPTTFGRVGFRAAVAARLPTMKRGGSFTCSKIIMTQPQRSPPTSILVMPRLRCCGNAPAQALALAVRWRSALPATSIPRGTPLFGS